MVSGQLTLAQEKDHYFQIRNANSGKILTVAAESKQSRARILQMEASDSEAQRKQWGQEPVLVDREVWQVFCH